MLPGGSLRQLIEGTLYEVGDALQTKNCGCCLAGWGTEFLAAATVKHGFFLEPIFQVRHE